MSEKIEISSTNPDRRKFLKRTAIIAGGATIGTVGLYEIFKPGAGGTTLPPDSTSSTSSATSTTTGTSTTQETTSSSTSTGAGAVLAADAVTAYAYLGPEGDVTTQRDSSGSISEITYGPMTIQISRNSDGSVASIETSIPADSIKMIDTVNRNSDGSISGVSRQWPS